MADLLLASTSPRRREILEITGFRFRVISPPLIDESALMCRTDMKPEKIAVLISLEKAKGLKLKKGQIALTADTIVVVGKQIMGKPKDDDEAREFLRKLSGKTHRVITGLTLVFPTSLKSKKLRTISEDLHSASTYEVTCVTFKRLTDDEIEWYISSGEPFDKAGAYAIQGLGGIFIKGIEGCYFNVVGLPVYALISLMSKLGLNYRDFIVKSKEKVC